MPETSEARLQSGLLFGLIAYVWWGLVPLYFNQLRGVLPGEILAHRIVWSVGLIALVMLGLGGVTALWRTLCNRRLMLTLAASALLLAVNWLLYIYATLNGHVTEASLGYYVLPLVNAFLATVFLGEKLRPLHYPALALVAIGVAFPSIASQSVPWLALAVSVSFGLYGLVRKTAPVGSFTGLTVETLLMLPASVTYLVWLRMQGTATFGEAPTQSILLACGGLVTVIPLLTFTLAIRRLPLLALNVIQVLSPTMQLLVAVWWNREPIAWPMWAALACVWVAVALFLADAVTLESARRRARRAEVPEPVPA